MFLNFTDSFASPPGPLIDNRTGCPWQVPTQGQLSLSFQSTAIPPSADSLVTDDAIAMLTSTSTKHTTDAAPPRAGESKQESDLKKRGSRMIDRGVLKSSVIDEDFYITCEQAEVSLVSEPLFLTLLDQILLTQFQQDNQSPIIHVRAQSAFS